MNNPNLVFKISTVEVYGPILVDPTITLNVSNLSEDTIEDLGIYIVPTTSLGEVDYLSDNPPHTDYEDLLTWGTETDTGDAAQGGLYIEAPTSSGTFSGYVTRSQGAAISNKIAIQDIPAGDSIDIDLTFETPTGSSARRFYVDIVVE